MIEGLTGIDNPVVSAVNGPAHVHSELILCGDLIIAAEGASFQDHGHFPASVVPGDGIQGLRLELLDPLRAKHFLLTGQDLDAVDALRQGVVGQIVPHDTALARARELAEDLAKRSAHVLRYTRLALNQSVKRHRIDYTELGLALEGHGLISLATRRLVSTMDPLPLSALQQSVGRVWTLGVLAVALLAGLATFGLDGLPLPVLLLAAASGVIQYALAFWLYLFALQSLPANIAGFYLTRIPVFGIAAAFVSRQHSTGGKQTLLGIAKRSSSYLRTLIVHGAWSVMMHLNRSKDGLGVWVDQLRLSMHANKAVVALAAKISRIVLVILTNPDATYERRAPEAAAT